MRFILLQLLLLSSLFSHSYFEQKDITKVIDITKIPFTEYSSKNSNFGFSKSIYWVKIDVKNSTDNRQKKVLHFPYTLLDYIDIYEFQDEKLLHKRSLGDLRVYKNDSFLPDPTYIFNLETNQSKIIYIKIETQGSMNIDISILDYEEFVLYGVKKLQALSFYFGAVFIMLLYNFILFLFIRDRSYLLYLSFHINYFIFSAALTSLAFAHIYPNIPTINSYAIPFLMSIGSTIAILFTVDFLHIRNESKTLFNLLKYLLYINITTTLLVFFISYYYSSILTSIVSLLSIVVILLTSIYSHFILKNSYAKYFALAWGVLLGGIFIIHLRNLGIIPVNTFTSYASLIGAFFELTFLSLALSHRYKIQAQEIVNRDQALYKQSRLASMGEMISLIAHQWRQPLNRLNLNLEVIKNMVQKENYNQQLVEKKFIDAETNLQYMSHTIEDFSNYFKPNKKKEIFNIKQLTQKAMQLLDARVNGIEIELPRDRDIELCGYINEYLQVILVILNNAIDNFEIKKVKQRKISLSIRENESDIYLSIKDNGGGINKEAIDKIFNPYFTTKFEKEGTGIGLYMAKMVIENSMHGTLKVESYKRTTTFTIITTKERAII